MTCTGSYRRILPTTVLALFLYSASASAQADRVDFETEPNGQVPIDNSALAAPYTFSFGTVSFYFESSTGTKVLPEFEAAGSDSQHGFLDAANRQDRAAGGDLGSWFLRQPTTGTVPHDFYVEYENLTQPINALSGEIWDIDGRSGGTFEQWELSLLNLDGVVVASTLSPRGILYTNSNSLDAKPWTFSFSNLATLGVRRLRIRYTGNVTDVGLAFNNFLPAAASATSVPTLGKSGSLSLALLLVGAGVLGRRKQRVLPGSLRRHCV